MVFTALCRLKNMRAIDGSNQSDTVTTDSLRWQSPSIEERATYYTEVIEPQATVFLCFLSFFFSFFLLNPFMFVFFKEDDTSKLDWHIMKFHMPKANNQWKNNYLHIYHFQHRHSLRRYLHCSSPRLFTLKSTWTCIYFLPSPSLFFSGIYYCN